MCEARRKMIPKRGITVKYRTQAISYLELATTSRRKGSGTASQFRSPSSSVLYTQKAFEAYAFRCFLFAAKK